MPSVPIVTPSLIAIVLNSIGVPPAARMPALTSSARRRWLIVARHRLDPGRRHADDRLGEVLVGEADGLEHRPRAGPVGAVGQRRGMALGGVGGGRRRRTSGAPGRRSGVGRRASTLHGRAGVGLGGRVRSPVSVVRTQAPVSTAVRPTEPGQIRVATSVARQRVADVRRWSAPRRRRRRRPSRRRGSTGRRCRRDRSRRAARGPGAGPSRAVDVVAGRRDSGR